MEKQCKKCEETKCITEFVKDKRLKSGYGAYCKTCKSKMDKEYRDRKGKELLEKKREYYAKNKENILKQNKEYREKNKEIVRERKRTYHQQNKESISKKKRELYLKNREEILKKRKKYYADNKEKIIERNNRYERERRQRDPMFRLRLNVRGAVYKALKRTNGGKYGSKTLDALGYEISDLKEHLEKQFDDHMTWDNYGTYWHVDHILPQSLYPYDSLDHPNFKKMWALENLQPLEGIENIKKGNKVIQDTEDDMDKN